MDKQATFDDLSAIQYVRSLTATQIDIIRFLEQGYYQAQIARRLHKSRSYVCQVVGKLESYGLVTARRISFTRNGTTRTIAVTDPLHSRATDYVVTPKLKTLLAQNPHKDGSYTLCIPHHLKIKIPILDQNRPPTTTGWHHSRSRSIHIKSWQPRGVERHLYHVETVGGTVGIEYHGSSLVAYRVDRTYIMAADVDEATTLAAAQIQDGVARFVEEQGWSGVRITLGSPQIIDRPHFAFPSQAAKQVIQSGGRLTSPGLYCDDSLAARGVPDVGEIETTDPILAAQIDQGLRNALNIGPLVEQSVARGMVEQGKTILDGFCQHLDPIQETLGSIYNTANTVLAHVQGGTTLEYQFTQIVTILTHTLNEMKELRDRIESLEQRGDVVPSGKEKDVVRTMSSISPGGAVASSRGIDSRTPPGRRAQSLPEIRAGLPASPAQQVPDHPSRSASGGRPVCMPDVPRPPDPGGTSQGGRSRKKKKKK